MRPIAVPDQDGVLVIAGQNHGGEEGLPLRQVGVDPVDLLLVAQFRPRARVVAHERVPADLAHDRDLPLVVDLLDVAIDDGDR